MKQLLNRIFGERKRDVQSLLKENEDAGLKEASVCWSGGERGRARER